MKTDLDSLATALYVAPGDLLGSHSGQPPALALVGIVLQISHAELIVLSVMQALLGYHPENCWLLRATQGL